MLPSWLVADLAIVMFLGGCCDIKYVCIVTIKQIRYMLIGVHIVLPSKGFTLNGLDLLVIFITPDSTLCADCCMLVVAACASVSVSEVLTIVELILTECLIVDGLQK